MAHTLSSRPARGLAAAALLMLLAACQPAEEEPVAPGSGDLAALLETASFSGIEGFPDSVTLAEGKWEGKPYVEGGNTFPGIYLARPSTTIGDLDGDGQAEVVTVLVSDTGGSGSFYHLVALRQSDDGGLEHFATYFLGDRLKIPSLTIEDGGIESVMLVPDEDDALCCPTQRVDLRYELDGDAITLESEHRSGPLERIYGYLVWGHENRSFKSCSGDREGWAIDSIQRHSLSDLYAGLATEPYEPIFVDIEGRWLGFQSGGFGEQFDDSIEITDVYRVEREGWGCDLDVDNVIFRATGNEPMWRLDVTSDRAELSALQQSETIVWEGDGQLSNQQFEFENDEYRIGITYLKIPCRDSMSGSFRSHQAEYRIGGRIVKGCAVPGGLDERR